MKNIKYVIGMIWRSNMRHRVLIDLLLTLLFIMVGILCNLLGAGVWAALLNGFWAGVFFGYGVFNCIHVFVEEQHKAEFAVWSAIHVRDEITRTLEAKGLIGHVVVSADHPPPEKMN